MVWYLHHSPLPKTVNNESVISSIKYYSLKEGASQIEKKFDNKNVFIIYNIKIV